MIKTYKNDELGTVRVITDENGKSWVCAKDVCDILGFANPTTTMRSRVNTGAISATDVIKYNAPIPVLFTNEAGLWALTSKTTQRNTRVNAEAVYQWLMATIFMVEHNIHHTDDTPLQSLFNFDAEPTEMLATQNDVREFNHPQFGTIRTVKGEQDKLYFNAKDVCDILGYVNAPDAIRKHVDFRDIVKCDTPTEGGTQLMLYLTEGGLNALILDSKLPEAQEIRYWITGTVMPSIYKTGAYISSNTFNMPTTMSEALQLAADIARKSEQQEKLIAETQQQLAEVKQQLEEQTTDAELGRNFKAAPKCMKMEVFVKSIGGVVKYKRKPLGRNKGFDWLRRHVECHHEYYGGQRYNVALQTAINRDHLRVFWEPDDNTGELRPITYVTPKGKEFYTNWFMNAKGDKPTYDVYYDELDENGKLIEGKEL